MDDELEFARRHVSCSPLRGAERGEVSDCFRADAATRGGTTLGAVGHNCRKEELPGGVISQTASLWPVARRHTF